MPEALAMRRPESMQALVRRAVQGFQPQGAAGHQPVHVGGVDAQAAGLHPGIGVQLPHQFGQDLHLGAAQMPGPELLPVEVGRVHHVIVDEQEMFHTAAGQHQDGIGAQAARTGHAHPGGTQGLQPGRGKIARQALTQDVLTHGRLPEKRFTDGCVHTSS